jgi:hypothetical protein
MTIQDCDRTRVAPVFNWLLAKDPSGRSWVRALLTLIGKPSTEAARRVFEQPGQLREAVWWPRQPLFEEPSQLSDYLGRMAEAAQRSHSRRRNAPHWFSLVEPPRPSALLVTARAMVVVEARRAMPADRLSPDEEAFRLLRDLDAIFDQALGRLLVGLLIVEENETATGSLDDLRREVVAAFTSRKLLARALPHRDREEQRQITGAFLGVTSWQHVCRELEIPWAALPESVLDVPPHEVEWCSGQSGSEGGDQDSVVVGRDLDAAIELHRGRLAKRASRRFPPVTLTDAARQALRTFYRSDAWRGLCQAASGGVFPVRRKRPTTDTWHFVPPRDDKLLAAITRHADLVDGTWNDAVDDALFRYYSRRVAR